MTINTLWIIVFLLIVFLIIRLVTKIAVKLITVLLILGGVIAALLYFQNDSSKKNLLSIEELNKRYCEEASSALCECVVKIVREDLQKNSTTYKKIPMNNKSVQGAYLCLKSVRKHKDTIKICLQQKGKGELYKDFLEDILPYQKKLQSMQKQIKLQSSKSLKDFQKSELNNQ